MFPVFLLKGVSVLKFVGRYWQIISLVLLIAGSFWYVKSLHNTIEKQANEIVELKVANAFCENSRAELKQGIDAQNQEIEKWAKVGKEAQANFDALKHQLEKERKQAQLELQKILQEPKPESCQEAIDYLIDGKKDLQW